jgi:histidyl-tRNA synthetase
LKFRSIRGTKDILPTEANIWQHIEGSVRRVMSRYNYWEIRTPIFEQTSLFARSIGELTDIVSKEMYTFLDRGEESITLRPEGTAAVLRAFIQNNLGEQSPLTKVYYLGPMFRQERPQAGRLRQFHQFGAEVLGSSSPQLDVEMMVLPCDVYRELGISNMSLSVNSVGCAQCRPRYREQLVAYLKGIQSKLSQESQARIGQNPLRVLDSKDEMDRELTKNAPLIMNFLCTECSTHFESVQSLLRGLNVHYSIDGRLVRGLDYYTKTAFEITSSVLGSQDALAGGGRYDLLVQELGGKETPGVGFAAGIERLVMVLEATGATPSRLSGPVLFIIGLDEESRTWAFKKASELRSKGVRVEVDYHQRSIKAQMREANRQMAEFVIVVGESERRSGSAKIKNMKSGEERSISLESLEQELSS